MPPSNRLITTPDDNVAMARRFQHRAIATLMAVCEDSAAPASAKSQAAAKLLEIGFGRPSMAKQITVADLATMPDDLKMQLLEALLSHYMPNGQRALLKAACDEAVRQAQLTFPKPNRFKRGAPPAPALNSPRDPIRAVSSADLASPAASLPAQGGPAHSRSNRLAHGPRNNLAPADNVVVIPGVAPSLDFRIF